MGHPDIKEISNLIGLLDPNEKNVLDALRALPVDDLLKLQEKLRDVRQKLQNLIKNYES